MKRILIAALAMICCFLGLAHGKTSVPKVQAETLDMAEQKGMLLSPGLYAGSQNTIWQAISPREIAGVTNALTVTEEEVYTFLQGPRAWEEGHAWSGEWNQYNINGNTFGGFGCGLCCMANIYDTLSPYECSPLDMLDYARTVSNYYPTGKAGAIDWEDMKTTMQAAGLSCGLFLKPGTYEEFQQQMKESKAAIVLVSSADDDTFWKDTPGHYVNISLYQEEGDLVFLAEPGDPEHNRSWIPLRYIYDALKTVSGYQYLAVTDYQEEKNNWKWDGIDEAWNRP